MSAASLCPGRVPAAVPSVPGQLLDLPTARTQNWTLYSHFSAKETEAGEIHMTSALNFFPRLLLFLRGHVSSSHTRLLPPCTACGPGVLGSRLSLLGPPHSRACSMAFGERSLGRAGPHIPVLAHPTSRRPGTLFLPGSSWGRQDVAAGAHSTSVWQGSGWWGCAGARELGHQHVHALAGPALADLQDDGNFWES